MIIVNKADSKNIANKLQIIFMSIFTLPTTSLINVLFTFSFYSLFIIRFVYTNHNTLISILASILISVLVTI